MNAVSHVEALCKAIEAQQIAFFAKHEGYAKGINAGVEVLDAERNLYSVKKDYANARYEYVINVLKLQSSVGTLGDEDITQVNRWLNKKGT